MIVVIASIALLLGGIFTIYRWGSLAVEAPVWEGSEPPPVSWVVRRYVWTVSVLVWTALITAILVVGPGARLAMRLLAVTAGAGAQGHKTEADEIVGRISVGGTIGIFIFVGLFAGFVSALTFIVVRRWLPGGRLGGIGLGVLLLVVFGSRLEPLRANNPDFDLVGPPWVSITVYSAMALVQGMAVFAVAGRVSRWLPFPGPRFRAIAPHAILLLTIPTVVVPAGVIALGAVAVLLSRTPVAEIVRSTSTLIVGRVVLAVATLAALPGFVSATASIAGRGP
jgi:hypothetical protein